MSSISYQQRDITPYEEPDVMLLEKNGKLTVEVEIITFVIELGGKSIAAIYNER